jgi:hypothetical protein
VICTDSDRHPNKTSAATKAHGFLIGGFVAFGWVRLTPLQNLRHRHALRAFTAELEGGVHELPLL